MAKSWKSSPTPGPTTITEICRRYVATAATLAKVLGLPLTERFLQEYREQIACCFIESGRAGVRLPPSVTLPRLAAPETGASVSLTTMESSNSRHTEALVSDELTTGRSPNGQPRTLVNVKVEPDVPDFHPPRGKEDPSSTGDAPPLLTTIPPSLPMAGQPIAALTPPQLAMLLNRVASLVHAEGQKWAPVLAALQSERARRVERGRQPAPNGQP
jgi:hypothetical protein